jgi:hypothetical protein
MGPGVAAAGEGGGAAAWTSHSACPDVTCSCPDLLYYHAPVMHVSDVFSATIKSPAIFSCPLASPSPTSSTGCPQSSRKAKHSKLRGNTSLGSSSKLKQSASDVVVSSSFHAPKSDSPSTVPLSSTLEFDKGIAYS